MASLALVDSKGCMDLHRTVLREYAERTIVHGDELSHWEAKDQAHRLEEFLAMGCAFKLTYKEMVRLIYGSLLAAKRDCGCHSCRSREGPGN